MQKPPQGWRRFVQGRGAAPSHAALNAELLLDILHTVKDILKLTPMHHLIEIEGLIQNSA
jgi:hypothetical protein